MTAPERIAGAVLILCAIAAWLYWWGGSNALRDREAAEKAAIETTEKGIADAIDRCSDLPWLERLRTDCR